MTTCWASQAADQEAARIDQADRRDEFVGQFTQDACDEILAEDDEAHFLIGRSPALCTLFGNVLNADEKSAYMSVLLLREALREQVLKDYPEGVRVRAEKLANKQLADMADEVPFHRLNELPLAAICPVPAFPSLRGGL